MKRSHERRMPCHSVRISCARRYEVLNVALYSVSRGDVWHCWAATAKSASTISFTSCVNVVVCCHPSLTCALEASPRVVPCSSQSVFATATPDFATIYIAEVRNCRGCLSCSSNEHPPARGSQCNKDRKLLNTQLDRLCAWICQNVGGHLSRPEILPGYVYHSPAGLATLSHDTCLIHSLWAPPPNGHTHPLKR